MKGDALAPSEPGVYYHGRAGGRGGGGRIFVSGAVVSGVTRSAGTNGTGRTTGGEASVSINIYVSQVSFNYDTAIPTAMTSEPDGITLKIDHASGAITAPEWVHSTKQKLPTSAAYDSDISGPAAYIVGKPLKLKAKFKGAVDLASASISAVIKKKDGASIGYTSFAAQTVSFTSGESSEITFTSTDAHNLVEANDVVIEWNAESAVDTGSQSVGGFPISQTEHRIYTVRKLPVAPMAEPWAKILELSSILSNGLDDSSDDQTVIAQMASGLFWSMWMDQPTRFFSPVYNYEYSPSVNCTCINPENGLIQAIDLTEILNRLVEGTEIGEEFHEAAVLQCVDNANFLAALAASQGVVSRPLMMADATLGYLKTASYNRAGTSVFNCHINCFNFHSVPTWEPGIGAKKLYDTSAQACSSSLTSCETDTTSGLAGSNFFDYTYGDYLTAVFPSNTPGNVASGHVTLSISSPGTCPF